MKYRSYEPGDSLAIETLFISVFTRSEGKKEGALIGDLSRKLMTHTDQQDLYGFLATDKTQIVGAIFFSRLTVESEVVVFILSPVAIHSDYQGMGIGQELINYGLWGMKRLGVRIVTTYGDPAFYSKVGFRPLSQDVIRPPFELSQPEGWLGQSLTGDPIQALPGCCSCVQALNNPAYW